MTDVERNALRAYLVEVRRHHLALAKAAEVLLAALAPQAEKSDNRDGDGKTITYALIKAVER